ncbi:MAG: response regulator [Rhodospirillales bacterium]|nr:response regulator [Rhodospirillales bacterium]MCB9964520.1 response regulator [Rhodospirillales bacterium]MCB9973793.1 response regulator [Rhodospirillales bacterium]MCB9980323.1 response regulator [Rhodospirillales bacterium]
MPLNLENLSVLVVEDTLPMRKIIHAVLMTLGVGKIYNAENGEEGYRNFLRHNQDIIITDWHMPNVNGLDLIQMIRRNANSPNRLVPIIMMTGYSAFPRVSQARDYGVTEFLVKPFSAEDLAKRLAHVINKPRDFIESPYYFGPCRRRKDGSDYRGLEKRRSRP